MSYYVVAGSFRSGFYGYIGQSVNYANLSPETREWFGYTTLSFAQARARKLNQGDQPYGRYKVLLLEVFDAD